MRRSRSDGWGWRAGGPVLAGVLLAAASPVRVSAQVVSNSGALFLVFPVGAQAVGMGQAAMAAEGRSEAAFWNPAGLATLSQDEFTLHSAMLPAGAAHAVSVYFPSRGIGVIGGAIYLVDYGDFDRTDSLNNTIGRIAPRDLEFLASYAAALGDVFTFGINYKLIEFRVDCSGDCRDFPNGEGLTHAIDIGGQLALGDTRALRLGFALRNAGFKLQVQNRDQADPLPARLAAGVLYRVDLPGGRPADPDHPSAEAEHLDVALAADVESSWGETGQPQVRLGFDVGYRQLVRLRGGYAFLHDGLSGPSFGMGVQSGTIGVDLARTFLTGSDLMSANPTFVAFRLAF
ncbi:MAG TPA: PorV/PorQ family protein [Gemmatimonadales bacterium]